MASRFGMRILGLALLAGCAGALQPTAAPAQSTLASGLQVDTRYFTLPNGLKVVLSRDTSVPSATVAVYYGIGFRIEPRNRTGFAHLFEHLMFMGSENVPRGMFDRWMYNAGGFNNGSTRFDFTNYYEVVPKNALDLVLWMEADRMARPVIDQAVLKSQQGVVANEVKVNVLNQPYGNWLMMDLPMLANTNWHNAHNFYGELADLEAATVPDAKDFFRNYYRPGNAVVVVAGDIDYDQTRALITRYFAPIPSVPAPPPTDISEPRQTAEKRKSVVDKLAPKPGFSAAWHIPARGTPEWYAMGLIDQLMVQGNDSRLYKALVQDAGFAGELQAGINYPLGNMFNYQGPMFWTVALVHDADKSPKAIEATIDREIGRLQSEPVSATELARARTKIRSFLYDQAENGTRVGLVDLLATYALFDNDPSAVNRIEAGFAAVTPELIQRTAREFLRTTNRSILLVEPGAQSAAKE
jgi:zinc protease